MANAKELEWLELTDFSPGIFSNNNLAGGVEVTASSPAMAQETNTYRCRSLPTGGLGPLPRRKFDFTLADPPEPAGGTPPYSFLVNGLGTWGQVFGDVTNFAHRIEVHLPISIGIDDGGGAFDNFFWWMRERIYDTPQTTETIYSDSSAADTLPERVQFAFLLKTRINPAAVADPGQPVMVCVYGGFVQTIRVSRAAPDPASPTTNSTVEMGDESLLLRRAVAHQGRIVFGRYIAYDRGVDTSLSTDENVLYTNTNDDALSTPTAAVYVPEIDSSITDWSSMSANQLVVVKSIGGGYVLQGDLDDVTVVRLPNLMCPDGSDTVQGANTGKGWIYSAGDRGLYIWNGGDSSEAISSQLDGRAFTETGGVTFAPDSHRGQCDRWMDLFLAPDLWTLDLEYGGWWRLDDPDDAVFAGTPVCYWSTSKYEQQTIGSRATFDWDGSGAAEDFFYLWEYDDLAYDYSWQSHPFWISRNWYMDVREGVIALQGTGTVTIDLIGNTGAVAFTIDINIDHTNIRNYRFNIGPTLAMENMIVRLRSSGLGAGPEGADVTAPLIHRLFLGYRQAQNLALSS